jgi:hypothetical protein
MSMKNKIIAVVVLGVATIALMVYAISLTGAEKTEIKHKSLTFEYGDAVKITKADVFGKADVDQFHADTSSIKQQDNKDIAALGTYKVKITYTDAAGSEQGTITVHIKDTKKPEFTKAPASVEVENGESDHDFNQDFAVEDLSGVKLTFDTSKVDFATAGEYDAAVTAEDGQGNKTEKNFKVVVKAAETTEDTSTAADTTTTTDTTATTDTTTNTTGTTDSTTSSYNANTNYGYYDANGNYIPYSQQTQTTYSGSYVDENGNTVYY